MSSPTEDWYQAKLRRIFPRASESFLTLNNEVSNPEPQSDKAPALGSPAPGKKEVLARVAVRFTGFRVRPLDPDNFAASVKDSLDGLRRCGLLHGDEPWKIQLITDQEKVSHFKEERTEIEITYPSCTFLQSLPASQKISQ